MLKQSKYINVRARFVQDLVAKGEMCIEHVDSSNKDADIMTKPLGKVRLREAIARTRPDPAFREEC